jgi:hypothetical protein
MTGQIPFRKIVVLSFGGLYHAVIARERARSFEKNSGFAYDPDFLAQTNMLCSLLVVLRSGQALAHLRRKEVKK